MALDGIAAIHARIQAIEQQLAGVSPAKTATTASGETGGSGAKTSAGFASMLSDAMNVQGASALGIGGSGPSGASGSGGLDLSALLGQAGALTGANGTAPVPTLGSAPNTTTTQFLSTALAQSGKPYVWGSTVSPTDASPASFDCSELTKWAAARSGVSIPDGAAHQYAWLKEQGATMTVEQALRTPGALLFHFASEPQPGLGGEPPVADVAISLGNGKTIEARGRAYGVGSFEAGDRFNYAGMIPGMA